MHCNLNNCIKYRNLPCQQLGMNKYRIRIFKMNKMYFEHCMHIFKLTCMQIHRFKLEGNVRIIFSHGTAELKYKIQK